MYRIRFPGLSLQRLSDRLGLRRHALARVDPESYYDLYTKLSPQAAQDLAWNNQFWERFEGPVAEASTQMNDRYLKAHSQEDGVRSYGRMVDLMLAYYKDQLRED